MFDKFREECGVVAIYGHPEASKLAYLGLYAQQHRGQESAGICTSDGTNVYTHKAMGHVADIFTSNALKNGLLPVIVDESTAEWLIAHPDTALTIDLTRSTLALPDGTTVSFPLEAFARHCLLEGVDELGFLLAREIGRAHV